MSTLATPTVRGDGSGKAVLIKHAAGPERLRLHHEAQVLAAARIDGVVECVGLDEFDDRCELALRYIEAATLAELPPLRPDDLMGVLIELGTTLADLHARGIRHGALRGDHVLLAQPCRPVLCGFGEASGPADQSQHRPGTDLIALAELAASELTRADQAAVDVAERRLCADALNAARFLAAASASDPRDSEPLTEWLVRMRHIRDTAGRGQPAAIDDLGSPRAPAAAFAHDPHGLREQLRAQDAASLPPDAETRGPHDAVGTVASMPDRRRTASFAAVAAALGVAAVIGWRTLTGSDPGAGAPAELAPISAAPAPAAAPTPSDAASAALGNPAASGQGAADTAASIVPDGHQDPGAAAGADHGRLGADPSADIGDSSPTQAPEGATLLYATPKRTPSHDCPAPSESTSRMSVGAEPESDDAPAPPDEKDADRQPVRYLADLRGDGCPVTVLIEQPTANRSTAAVHTPDGTWTVGTLDDLVAIGDWDCDGRATAATVSTATGTVSFFGSWPHTERPVAPTRSAHVPPQATAVSTLAPDDAPTATASRDELACDALVVHYDDLSLTLPPFTPAVDTASWLARQ